MAAYSWENRPLNDEDDEVGWGEYSGDDDDLDTEMTAGMEFVKAVLNLLFAGILSARIFCSLMWLAGRAGISEASGYGLKPGSPSGHYSRKVRDKLGWSKKNKNKMLLQVPSQGKHDIERSVQSVSVEPGHEQFVDDYNANTSSFQRLLAKFKSDENLPPCYWNHPVVPGALAGVLVFPVALYLDGVPYSITDSVIGFWLVSLIDSRRYLIGLLRKRNLCKCGCKGWCTFWHFFAMLHWDLKAGAEGRYPDARYDGPWLAGSDDARKERSSHILPFKLACLYIKGDWMELGTTIGLPTWQDALRPCFCCNAFSGNFWATSGMTMEALTWAVNTDDDYFAAASRCELEVPIRSMLDVKMLLDCLMYDKRKTGARGRALVRNLVVGGVSLLARDRLEPCAALPDVGQLENLDTFPTIVIFWRASADTLT
jgi:hypothetical protein